MKKQIPFVNLAQNYQDLRKDIIVTVDTVFIKGNYILGDQVRTFEQEFAKYLRVTYAIAVASGTDALHLSLKALHLDKSDEIILPANAYPTAHAVAQAGLAMKLVDIDPLTHTIDVRLLEKTITKKTKAIISVHLYGQAANMDKIMKLAKKFHLFVIEDVAQAHGAFYGGKRLGAIGITGCFSFYPTKNLGAHGDGGMIVTNSKRIATLLYELRQYGERKRYNSIRVGMNSRLDEIQAAILRVKLRKLDSYNKKRIGIAKLYAKSILHKNIIHPQLLTDGQHVYHMYVIQTKQREKIKKMLDKKGIETAVRFPLPIHLVPAFAYLGYKKGDFPNAEHTAKQILCLPIYPELTNDEIEYICRLVQKVLT